jgi:hypothetical protein
MVMEIEGRFIGKLEKNKGIVLFIEADCINKILFLTGYPNPN